ncbi:MAG: hypothetical protein K1X74_20305 [Pirellulales bacterium]|nr:hypothetical protein [Pirellulales bacterium]
MSTWKLMWDEIRYRKLNFGLSVLAVTIAVGLITSATALIDGYHRETCQQIVALEESTDAELAKMEDETRKLMLKMGFNLLIVHRETDMNDFWSADFSTVDMPQEYVDRLAQSESLTLVTHLVATLQQRIEWNQRKVLLVGYLPETPRPHETKKPMGLNIEPGTVYVGHELGVGLKPGDSLEIQGRSFRIAAILPEKGSKEDITLALHLSDAQALTNRPGRINQMLAIGCQCAGERLPKIRAQLAEVLPETKITEFNSIAVARAEQRDLVAAERKTVVEELATHRDERQRQMENFAGVLAPVGVLGCGIWVGLLALANVRQRQVEIGLLRALGQGSLRIASLFMGKAVLLGALGAVLGFAAGAGLARWLLVSALSVAASEFAVPVELLPWAIVGAPLLCAVASYLPTLVAVLQDPAVVLRDA